MLTLTALAPPHPQTIFGINFINLIYFFVTKPKNDADPLRIIVSSLATVLTTTMTMRIILLVRGSLAAGGSFHGSTAPTSSMSGGGGNTHNGTSGGQGFHITGGANSAAGGGRSKGTNNAVPSIPGSRGGNANSNNPIGVGAGETKNKMSQPTFAIARHPRGVGSDGGDGVYDVDVEDVDVYHTGEGKKGTLGGLGGMEEEEVWQGDKQ